MEDNQNLEKMKKFIKKHIKSPLLSSTWEKEGQTVKINNIIFNKKR